MKMKNFSTIMHKWNMVSQIQMCAKRKTLIYLKFYFHAPKTIFLCQNRIDGSKRAKLQEKMAAVKGNLISSFLTSYKAQSSFYSLCINLPLHQPAPVSPSFVTDKQTTSKQADRQIDFAARAHRARNNVHSMSVNCFQICRRTVFKMYVSELSCRIWYKRLKISSKLK